MHDLNTAEPKIVGFESQPIPQSSSNMKTLAITGACLLAGVVAFCSLTGTRFVHDPIGTVGRNPDGSKYVSPHKDKPSQTPEEVQQFVKDYMEKSAARIYGE
jgi:hypothetical protein